MNGEAEVWCDVPESEEVRQAKIAELRRLWQEGLDSGPSVNLDFDEMWARLEARLKADDETK